MTADEQYWLKAAAGDPQFAEELKAGRCRCGAPLGEVNDDCSVHPGKREKFLQLRHFRAIVTDTVEHEVLLRFLPKEFQLLYEELVGKAVVFGGGHGYDENVDPKAGVLGNGSEGGTKSERPQRRLVASPPKKFGSGKTVVRNQAAIAYRQRVDRKIRKIAREIKLWLDDSDVQTSVRKCTSRKCGRFAEDTWWYCPNCGAPTDRADGTD